jgi:hypothetical protein
MPGSSWTPTIVPYGADQTVYLVIDRFGQLGSVYRETEVERTDLETVITDLMSGQFNDPIRVVASPHLSISLRTSRKILRSKSRPAATFKAPASPSMSKTSLPTTSVRPGSWRCGWFDPKWWGKRA